MYYDLLLSETYFHYLQNPSRLRHELEVKSDEQLAGPIIIDEVQKIPALLDEVHWLIENRRLRFILCGSSARKLKRGQANLLGGRAWRYEMFPLVYPEIDDFDLLRSLNHGLIPSYYHQERYAKSIESYTFDYLKEEVLNEGLLEIFQRFLVFLKRWDIAMRS